MILVKSTGFGITEAMVFDTLDEAFDYALALKDHKYSDAISAIRVYSMNKVGGYKFIKAVK